MFYIYNYFVVCFVLFSQNFFKVYKTDFISKNRQFHDLLSTQNKYCALTNGPPKMENIEEKRKLFRINITVQ